MRLHQSEGTCTYIIGLPNCQSYLLLLDNYWWLVLKVTEIVRNTKGNLELVLDVHNWNTKDNSDFRSASAYWVSHNWNTEQAAQNVQNDQWNWELSTTGTKAELVIVMLFLFLSRVNITGDWSFRVVGRHLRNALRIDIKCCGTLSAFRKALKMHIFKAYYC